MPLHDSAGEEATWVAFTIRLPAEMHEWLRYEAFFQRPRTTMSEIVREEIAQRMARSGRPVPGIAYDSTAVAVGETTGPMGIVKP
jgi:hypothetical protein